MSDRANRILDTLDALEPLAALPRTGWLLRGVRPCESIADHSYGVSLCALLLVDALRAEGQEVDGETVLRMAIVHDAPEAAMGDVPMPVKTPELDRALTALESTLADRLLPRSLADAWRRMEEGACLEARIVKAADKIHMMHKALVYERQGHGGLREFWSSPQTFHDRGLGLVAEVFTELRRRRPAAEETKALESGAPPATLDR